MLQDRIHNSQHKFWERVQNYLVGNPKEEEASSFRHRHLHEGRIPIRHLHQGIPLRQGLTVASVSQKRLESRVFDIAIKDMNKFFLAWETIDRGATMKQCRF